MACRKSISQCQNGATRIRTRQCNNPAPKQCGKGCNARETVEVYNPNCGKCLNTPHLSLPSHSSVCRSLFFCAYMTRSLSLCLSLALCVYLIRSCLSVCLARPLCISDSICVCLSLALCLCISDLIFVCRSFSVYI